MCEVGRRRCGIENEDPPTGSGGKKKHKPTKTSVPYVTIVHGLQRAHSIWCWMDDGGLDDICLVLKI